MNPEAKIMKWAFQKCPVCNHSVRFHFNFVNTDEPMPCHHLIMPEKEIIKEDGWEYEDWSSNSVSCGCIASMPEK